MVAIMPMIIPFIDRSCSRLFRATRSATGMGIRFLSMFFALSTYFFSYLRPPPAEPVECQPVDLDAPQAEGDGIVPLQA